MLQAMFKVFSLGKVLPGQRDGSLLWYRDITSYLKLELGMEEHAAYPCLLKSPDGSCAVLIHVDDLLVVGRKGLCVEHIACEAA